MADEKRLTLAKAAEIAGVDPSTLRHAIRDNRLRAEKFGRDWSVLETDLLTWISNPDNHRTGRKKS